MSAEKNDQLEKQVSESEAKKGTSIPGREKGDLKPKLCCKAGERRKSRQAASHGKGKGRWGNSFRRLAHAEKRGGTVDVNKEREGWGGKGMDKTRGKKARPLAPGQKTRSMVPLKSQRGPLCRP